MKWTLLLMISLLAASHVFAQTNPVDSLQKTDTIKTTQKKEVEQTIDEKINKVLLYIAEQTTSEDYYKLYPTTNIWTFLKLDTRNGRIWQVQFSIKGDDYRFQTLINAEDLSYEENDKACRFELYPTQNMYNFLLLEKNSGRVWQVQWSMESKDRVIKRIY